MHACVCMLILYVCLMKTLPYRLCSCRIVCVRFHQYDMSLMWKYMEQKPSQPHSSPQQDTSTTVHVHTCVFEFGREAREVEKEKHKEPQATTSTKSYHCLHVLQLQLCKAGSSFDLNIFSAKGSGGLESICTVCKFC